MSQTLNGKVALVTGGGTGIGFGAARRLAEAGAFVYITGRRLDVLEEAAKSLGDNVRAIKADVSKKADMDDVAAVIKREKSNLDIVFSNAGFCIGKSLEDITEDFFDAAYNTNIKGNLFTVQSMLPIMKDGGSIILTSSMTAFIGLPDYTVYAATKAAIQGMAKVWTTELKSRKIRVNVISPGAVPTEGYEQVQGMSEEQVREFTERITVEIPAGHVGTAENIGDAVVFLGSDASSFINGVNLTVDGGQTQVYAGRL